MDLKNILSEFKPLRERYKKQMADSITVSVEDLTETENALIEASFELFQSKLDDIKMLEDDNKRLNIELINLKLMHDDSTNDYDLEN